MIPKDSLQPDCSVYCASGLMSGRLTGGQPAASVLRPSMDIILSPECHDSGQLAL